eukprot:1120685-Prymnesium_polylepis.1
MDHSAASDVTVDDLGNKYVKISSSFIHFKQFKGGFSPQDVAYERWLERLVEPQARKPENGSKSVSKCFKCGATGHWARDCSTSKQGGDPAEPSSNNAEEHYPRVSETTKVKKEISRKPYNKPRLLSKAPPRRQPSAKDAFQRIG